MAFTTQFLAETDRRRATSPAFYDGVEEYLETLPGYTRNQIQSVGVWKFKVKK